MLVLCCEEACCLCLVDFVNAVLLALKVGVRIIFLRGCFYIGWNDVPVVRVYTRLGAVLQGGLSQSVTGVDYVNTKKIYWFCVPKTFSVCYLL